MEENEHLSEEHSDWEIIQSPFSAVTAKRIGVGNNSSEVIKDDFFSESSAFPPGNHEDLPIGSPQDNNQHSQTPEQIPLISADGGDDGVKRWRKLQLGVLQARILQTVRKFKNYAACKVGLCSFAWTAGGVAAFLLVISFLCRRVLIWWKRRVQLDSSKESLELLLREKDKKINQLLLQIAQMNEILLARRRVPVIRVK